MSLREQLKRKRLTIVGDGQSRVLSGEGASTVFAEDFIALTFIDLYTLGEELSLNRREMNTQDILNMENEDDGTIEILKLSETIADYILGIKEFDSSTIEKFKDY